MKLGDRKCVPCEGGAPPLAVDQVQKYLTELKSGWEVLESKKIRKEFSFKDFKAAIEFVKKVAALAEEEGHHPDIYISYNKVQIWLWTHAIGGLSENDFILAAKIDAI